MFFDDIRYQLEEELMRNCFALRRDQILCFFRDSGTAEADLETMLNSFIYDKKSLIMDEQNPEIIRYAAVPAMTNMELYNHINAFWPIAYFGSTHVKKISTLSDAGQYLFSLYNETKSGFTEDLFDIAVISSKKDAVMNAVKIKRLCEITPEEDYVKHIALVPDMETGKEIMNLGYDVFAVLDGNHKPSLYSAKSRNTE